MPRPAALPVPAISRRPMQRLPKAAVSGPPAATHPDNACLPHAWHRPPASPPSTLGHSKSSVLLRFAIR